MMARKFFMVLLIIFGFVLGPTNTYANTFTVEKACCKKQDVKKSCCQSKANHKKADNNHKSCEQGSCGCSLLTSHTISVFTLPAKVSSTVLLVLPYKKHQFFYNENTFSTVFNTIWLPPKIA